MTWPHTYVGVDTAKAKCGVCNVMIFDRFANLKYKYGNRVFWCRGYYVDTVGRNRKAIEEYYDPFTGDRNK